MDAVRRWRGWRSQPRRRIREDSRRRAVTRVRRGARADLDVHRRLKPGGSLVLVVCGIALAIAGAVTTDWRGVGAGVALSAVGVGFVWWDGD